MLNLNVMASTWSGVSRCYIYQDCAWVHRVTNEKKTELHYTSPYKVVAYTQDGRMVPLCLEDPSEMKVATAYAEGQKYSGILDKHKESWVTLRKQDGKYLKVEYDALELGGNPYSTIVKWACETPVELRYKTTGVKWTNIVEVNACTEGPSTISDTALVDSDLPYQYEGEVTLIKSENPQSEDYEEKYEALSLMSSGVTSVRSSYKVASNPEVHKCLGVIALPPLMKVDLCTAPFEYQMVYGISLNGAPKKNNANIQLESLAPWYIRPAKCNLQYGNYHCCYNLPSTAKGERISFPVAKSPEVYYGTEVNYTTKKEGENYIFDLTIDVTVEDSTGARDKHFIFSLDTGKYQVVSSQPAPTAGLQAPGVINWKASCSEEQFRTSFRLTLVNDSSYFSL